MLENFLTRFKKKDNKQSISFVEIPAQYETELFRIAQDRYHIVKEVNELCGENGDIRFQRANALIGEDATKGGFSIIVNASEKDNKRKQKQLKQTTEICTESQKVQKIVDDFLERTKLHILCTEHARALLREGDLFLNVIVDKKTGLITKIKRAPALTIKRNIDEYGNFIDNQKAFSQIDISQIYQMAGEKAPQDSRKDFALYQINHIRWLCDETKIYGMSQYAVARKCYKMLAKMEEALAYRRIYRSVSKRSHRLETTDIAEIEDYKRANAMVDENGTPTSNAHMLTDYIGNVEVSALHDEANLDEIKDVEMIENMLWINLLVPKAIITGGQGINRDVLKVQYPHYLQTLENITDRLEYGDNSIYSGYRAIIDFQLLLQGINPENVSYDIVWSRKTEESTTERIESIQNALAKGGGKQLISHEKAIQLVADDFDIEDPSRMYQKILEENGEQQKETQQQKEVKKKNPVSEEEVLTDEHEKDFEEIERLSKEFTKKWESFFNGIWEEVKESTAETIESNIKKAWQKQDKKFYMEYVKNAYDLGEKRAHNIIEQVFMDDENDIHIRIGIEKQDIAEELLNNSLLRVSKMEQTTIEEIRKILSNGYEQGESWKEQKKKIENKIKNPVRAEMIAITELGHAYNESTKNTYKGAGASKVVWHASLDLKTCEVCRSLHGQVFTINEAPDNPLHPRCRCTWLPVFSERKSRSFDNIPKTIDKKDNSNYNKIRTQEELQRAAEKMKVVAEEYSVNPSKWSGKILVNKDIEFARKEWNCDITVANYADDGMILHEMLHSCSCSHYDVLTYAHNQFIEEGSVEFLKQQICKEKGIKGIEGYEDFVEALKNINKNARLGTDLEFAKKLFHVPLPNRYEWLEDKITEILIKENVSLQDYEKTMNDLIVLRNGEI